MAQSPLSRRKRNIRVIICWWHQMLSVYKLLGLIMYTLNQLLLRMDNSIPYGVRRAHKRNEHLQRLIYEDNAYCRDNLRVNTRTFLMLCQLLEIRGRLIPTKNVSIDEMVAMFLNILAHHTKNRVIRFNYWRSSETVHRHFRKVLNALIQCHSFLLATLEPIPEDSSDRHWKWFKGCLGALDGTHIPIRVDVADKGRYRTRKAQIATNVLGVCNPNMEFTYVLPGWEGSAADGRVLRDVIHRTNGLRVPRGQYYLYDAGYTNGEGFVAPYRGQRYHISEWSGSTHSPSTPKELFNYRHSSARNIIERAFGAIKMRWAILRSPSFYPIDVQIRIIAACCLLHNLITREMLDDPIMVEVDAQLEEHVQDPDDTINHVETSPQWTQWREHMAEEIWNNIHPT